MPKTTNDIDQEQAAQIRGRCEHIKFMEYCWQRKKPFLKGVHTEAICNEIDIAFENYRNGISTFLIILVCFRQGKSEIVSRFLPAHFLGEFPDEEVVLASHNSTIANKFSRFARGVVRSSKYKELYPGVDISKEKPGLEEWGVEGTQGAAQFMGIQSGTAGKGGALCVIDDYFGNREEAESERMREKIFDAFTDDIFTRRADPCIFLFTVTPWHVDDVVGRVQKKMAEDAGYPQFKILRFPAKSDKYESGYLFPELYSQQWYEDMIKVLGPYGTASLMQCDPQIKTGNMLRTDKIKFYDDADEIPDNIQWVRGWDLASSKKQKVKSDPDFTVGVKMGVIWIKSTVPGHNIPILYIDDVIRGQWESTQRNKIIVATTTGDGYIRTGIESFGPYKDAYTEIRDVLLGIRSVEKMQLPGDKVAKASPLEPIFEAGNVYMRRADWNESVIHVIRQFPGGAHDDDVDALAVGFGMSKTSGLMIYTEGDYVEQESKETEIIEKSLQRIEDRQTVGCNLNEYTGCVREALVNKLDDSEGDKRQFIINEISRLDRALGYEDLEGIV